MRKYITLTKLVDIEVDTEDIIEDINTEDLIKELQLRGNKNIPLVGAYALNPHESIVAWFNSPFESDYDKKIAIELILKMPLAQEVLLKEMGV